MRHPTPKRSLYLGMRDGDLYRIGGSGDSSSASRSDFQSTLSVGDTVSVERAPVFYIYGEVAHGGAFRLENDMTVMQAIAAGGGITPRGSDRRIKMRSTGGDGKVAEKDAALSDKVKADDVIYVKEALF